MVLRQFVRPIHAVKQRIYVLNQIYILSSTVLSLVLNVECLVHEKKYTEIINCNRPSFGKTVPVCLILCCFLSNCTRNHALAINIECILMYTKVFTKQYRSSLSEIHHVILDLFLSSKHSKQFRKKIKQEGIKQALGGGQNSEEVGNVFPRKYFYGGGNIYFTYVYLYS